MASDLREKLEKLATSELNLAHLRVGARLALESLPCREEEEFGKPCVLVIGPGSMCDRCQHLASLASEGKG